MKTKNKVSAFRHSENSLKNMEAVRKHLEETYQDVTDSTVIKYALMVAIRHIAEYKKSCRR